MKHDNWYPYEKKRRRLCVLEMNAMDLLAGAGLSIPALTDTTTTTQNVVEIVQTKVCVWINWNLFTSRNIAFVFIESTRVPLKKTIQQMGARELQMSS